VYENAHQEQVYSWERTKIMEEIAVLELKQKRLITMLSQIDPVIYLQKLQQELSALQETNRRLKLTNIAERLERNQRGGSRTSSPRLPDSTSGELRSPDSSSASNSSSSSSSSTGDEEEEEDDDDASELNIGGCSSGCCLASPRPPCDVANLKDVEEEKEEGGPTGATEKASADNLVEEGDLKNPDETKEGSGAKVTSENIGKSTDLTLESAQEETDEENLAREDEIKAGSLTGGTEDPNPEAKTSCPKIAGKVTLKKDTEEAREKKIAVEQKEENSEGKSSEDGLSK